MAARGSEVARNTAVVSLAGDGGEDGLALLAATGTRTSGLMVRGPPGLVEGNYLLCLLSSWNSRHLLNKR